MNLDKNNIDSLIKVLRKAGPLKTLKRTGWVLKGVKDSESVADHTWRVCLFAALLSDNSLNRERLLDMAIVHDLGEIIVGDVKWEKGKKILVPEKPKRKKEEKAIAEIFKGHSKQKYYVSLLEEFTEQKTPEAKFLMQVDKLERTLQALEYEKKGTKSLNEFWESAERFLESKELEPIFRELQKMRKKSR